jgi:hypothetical protein
MSVGYSVNRNEVDSNAGNLSRQIEAWADQVLSFKAYLDATPDEKLTDMGYTTEDVALLKSSFNDLGLLADIYRGDEALAEPRDLGVFSRRMAGLIL